MIAYAVALMCVVTALNQIDRYVLFILIEPIRLDLGLSDAQIGIVTGLAFALAYAVAAIPVGRLADRYNRSHIVGACLLVWSIGTALFGLASGFVQLLMARMLVAAGEAGGYSPLQSQIADLVRPRNRAAVLAIVMFGGVLGMALGLAVAGRLNEVIGWRSTFMVLGLFGVCISPLVFLTLHEPVRGGTDTVAIDASLQPSISEAMREFLTRRGFVQVQLGLAIAGIAAYAFAAWIPTYYARKFAMTPEQLGIVSSLAQALPTALGTIAGGVLASLAAKRDARWLIWIPGWALAALCPLVILQLSANTASLAVICGILPSFATGVFAAPALAALQSLSGARLRATGTAFTAVALLLIGQGLGPSIAGVLSEWAGPVEAGAGLQRALMIMSFAAALGGALVVMSAGRLATDLQRASEFDLKAARSQPGNPAQQSEQRT